MRPSQATKIIKEVREQYNSIAEEWHSSRFSPSGIKMQQIKHLKKGYNVLDLGCGNGLVAGEIINQGVKYYGFDISGELIKIARDRYRAETRSKEMDFRVGDACRKLPYKNNFFDAAVSFAVLHHIPGTNNRLKFLRELRRVLKPNGWATLIVWNLLNDWPKERYGIAEQIKNPNPDLGENDFLVGWRATPGKNVKRYIHSFSAAELKELANEVGFSKITTGYYTRAGQRIKNGEELVLKVWK